MRKPKPENSAPLKYWEAIYRKDHRGPFFSYPAHYGVRRLLSGDETPSVRYHNQKQE